MLKKILILGFCVMSTLTYAESNAIVSTSKNPLNQTLDYSNKEDIKYAYEYTIKNKKKDIDIGIITSLGAPLSGSVGNEINEKCTLNIKSSIGTTKLQLRDLPASGFYFTLLPLKDENGKVETLLDLNITEYANKENKDKVKTKTITDSCIVSNNIASTTSVRWISKLSFDKEETFVLPNGDELYVTLSHKKPCDKCEIGR